MRIWLEWAPRTGWRLSASRISPTSPWEAARPGHQLSAVDTPAFILDLDAFDGHLERTVAALHLCNMRLRAHARSYKYPMEKVNLPA